MTAAKILLVEDKKDRRNDTANTLKDSGDAVITTDVNGQVSFLNPIAEKLTGWRQDEALGKDLTRVFHIINEHSGKLVKDPIKRLLHEGIILELANHMILVSKDGKHIPIDSSGAPIKDDRGNILGVVLIFRDITERRKTEAALAREKDLLYALMDNSPDHIYFKDARSRFIRINKALADVFGIDDPKGAEGKSAFDFFAAEHAQQVYQEEQEIMRSGKPIIDEEEKETWPDGSETWVSTTKMPLRNVDGEIIGTFSISKDITEHKKVEIARQNEKVLMNTLMDSIPDSIYLKDLECRLIKVNQTLIHNLGLERESQVIGKTDMELFGEKFGEETVVQDKKLMSNGESIINLIENRKLENGQINWTSTSKVPIRDANGKIVGLVGITREINKIKKAEQEREKIIKDLQEVLKKVHMLQGLIPICTNCKKIRNDDGYYEQLEKYISDHSGAVFSHGICPECMAILYPDYLKKGKKKA